MVDWLIGCMLWGYLHRDRLAWGAGVCELLLGMSGLYLSTRVPGTGEDYAYWLGWWALVVSAWLTGSGIQVVQKGWTDPRVEKEREIWRKIPPHQPN